ncbi:MAG: hypothetical protein ICV60_05785 [Pyrinomonadaceae bacterium]|nr:hypothetical protein [Pyrinomonadaceae bacterium]
MSMPPEDAAFDLLEASINGAVEGDVLYGAELLDNADDNITKDYGLSIGDCDGADIAPLRGGQGMEEYDAIFILVAFARVAGTDKSDKTARRAARAQARALGLEAAKVFHKNKTMNGQVKNSRILRGKRGFDSLESGEVYAVVNLPLIVNETGRQLQSHEIPI